MYVWVTNVLPVAISYEELDESMQLKDEGHENIFIFIYVLKPRGKYSCQQVSSTWLQALSHHLQHITRPSISSSVKSDDSLLHFSLKVLRMSNKMTGLSKL